MTNKSKGKKEEPAADGRLNDAVVALGDVLVAKLLRGSIIGGARLMARLEVHRALSAFTNEVIARCKEQREV